MKKFTVCIAMYNQMHYIETALKSVLEQNYKNIELIICDDCSKDYDKKKLEKIIKKYNKNNFTYELIHNEENLGIVKNVNNALNKATGDYILFFAADDKLYDENVVNNFIASFNKNKNSNIITTQCLLYDTELENIIKVFVNREQAFKVNEFDSKKQYLELCKGCIFGSGGTAYKTKFLKENGGFSTKYKHVEDWPNWLRFLINGNKIYYEDFITLCHRDGGISHNKSKKIPKHVQEYYNDMKLIYKEEMLKNLNKLTFKEKISVINTIFQKFLHLKKKKSNPRELDHTFIICAYKEQKNLENCLISLINQTQKSNIMISTSTPNDFVKNISKKYGVELVINKEQKGHAADFNFAYSLAKTKYVTLCHQDDIYLPTYAEAVINKMEKAKNPIIAFTNYYELRNDKIKKYNALLIVKRIINFPLRIFKNSKKVRLFTLSIGNAISAPTVTYNKKKVKQAVIDTDFKSNIDWITYIELAKLKGSFVYVGKSQLLRRIHEESLTTSVIANNIKHEEDYKIFQMFWPNWIAKILLKQYQQSELSNKVDKKENKKDKKK